MSLSAWFEELLGGAAQRSARPRHRQLELETLETRLTPYSVSGNAWPHPELITIGFVPDGTIVGSDASGPIVSNLQSSFNTKFGSAATWQNQILKAAQLWAQQTNINFAVVTDGGSEIGTGLYQQGDPNQADIRIGGYNFGSTTLAQAYLPAPINNTSYAGDMQFNTGQTWNINSTYDLFTVATHEFGHALGLYHSAVISASMYGSYGGVKSVLAADDVSGIRAVVGYDEGDYSSPGYQGARLSDGYDTAASNGTSATASDVTSTINAVAKTALVQNLDITATGDVDFYKFTVPAGMGGTLTVKAQSSGLSLLAPTLMLYNSAMTQLGTTQTAGTSDFDGSTLSMSHSVTAGQTYYVRVAGVNATATGTGKYALALGLAGVAAPTASPPITLTLNGEIPSAGGGQAIKFTPELLVNSTTSGTQMTAETNRHAVGVDASGNSMTVWASSGQDGGGYGIYAQRYDSSGVKVGSEFRVNTTTANDQKDAVVAMNSWGSSVVVWSSKDQDGNGYGIYAQRYNSSGVKVGSEFRVNTATANDQVTPVVSINDLGVFVVAWASSGQDGGGSGIYAQRYDALGIKLGSEFRVNTTTSGDQVRPSVALDESSNIVVTWSSNAQDGSGYGVYARSYDWLMNTRLGETRVNTTTSGSQDYSSVAIGLKGDAVITWTSAGQDGDGLGVYARRLGASAQFVGGEFLVNTTTARDQEFSAVAMDNEGNFLITWTSDSGDDEQGDEVYAQQFTSAGAKQGTEFRVNTTTSGDQEAASVAISSFGNAVVVWSGNGPGDSSGVMAQFYKVNAGSGLSNLVAGVPHGFGPDGCGHDHGEEGHSHGAGEQDHECCSQCGGTPHPANAASWDGTQELPFLRPSRREGVQTPGSVSLVGVASRLSEGIFGHRADSGVQVGVARRSDDQPLSRSLTIAAPSFAGAGRLTIAAPSLAGAARASHAVVGDALFASLGAESLDGARDAIARGLQRGRE